MHCYTAVSERVRAFADNFPSGNLGVGFAGCFSASASCFL